MLRFLLLRDMNIGNGKKETEEMKIEVVSSLLSSLIKEGVKINVSSSPSPSLVDENPMPTEVSRNHKRTIGRWIKIIKRFGKYTIACFAHSIIYIFQNL